MIDDSIRAISPIERILIADWLYAQGTYETWKDAKDMVDSHRCYAMSDYMPDNPGYAGTIIVCIWGQASVYNVFGWDEWSGLIEWKEDPVLAS